ncbi:MAG: SDR family oxidoreductase [Phycisphaerales bacterium]|nr:SDR family oxidoreductase [Phycisphaerales bacterium]
MSADTDRTAIITGGGTGIGRAIVQSMTKDGWHCVIGGRREDCLQETAQACESHSGTVSIVPGDLRSAQDVSSLVAVTVEHHGRVDAVINNGAMARLMAFPDWSEADLDALIETNVRGPIRLVRDAWPHLLLSRGCIINISSVAVLSPFPGNGAYGLTKCALDGLTRAIHSDTAGTGVRVFSIALGAVETTMLRSIVDESLLPREKTMAPGEIATVAMDCLSGVRDEQIGQVLYAAIPGFVTTVPAEAEEALARFHAPEGVG